MKLTASIATAIKADLWNGDSQSVVALRHKIRQPTVSGIARGHTWQDVPWPDGSRGALSPDRIAEIKREGRLADSGPAKERLDPMILEIADEVSKAMNETERDLTKRLVDIVELTRKDKPPK